MTFKSYFTVQSTLNILTIKTSTNRTGGFVMISANWKWPSAREVQSSWCSSTFSASSVTFMCHALVAGLNSGLTKINKAITFISFFRRRSVKLQSRKESWAYWTSRRRRLFSQSLFSIDFYQNMFSHFIFSRILSYFNKKKVKKIIVHCFSLLSYYIQEDNK